MPIDRPTNIVTAKPPPRTRPAPAAPVAIVVPRIVEARKPGKTLRTPADVLDDPEGDARVKAFFRRMMPNHPALDDD